MEVTAYPLHHLEEIGNNSSLHGADQGKLKTIYKLSTSTGSYRIGVFIQDMPPQGKIIHCKIENIDGSPSIDIPSIQSFLRTKFNEICFMQVFPIGRDFIDEGNTFHFFGIGKKSQYNTQLQAAIQAARDHVFNHIFLDPNVRIAIPCEGVTGFMDLYKLSQLSFPSSPSIQLITEGSNSRANLLVKKGVLVASTSFAIPNLHDFRTLH